MLVKRGNINQVILAIYGKSLSSNLVVWGACLLKGSCCGCTSSSKAQVLDCQCSTNLWNRDYSFWRQCYWALSHNKIKWRNLFWKYCRSLSQETGFSGYAWSGPWKRKEVSSPSFHLQTALQITERFTNIMLLCHCIPLSEILGL